MKVEIIGNVLHDNVALKKDEVYDLDEKVAKELIEAGVAKAKPNYPNKAVSSYTPLTVEKDKEGRTIPGKYTPDTSANSNPSAKVEATEPKGKGVKAVELSQDSVKGDDSKEETKEK